MTLKQLEAKGRNAVLMLRKTKLSKGLPFMINSDMLPSDQCYMEYPDGSINIVTIDHSKQDFKLIRALSANEITGLRKRYRIF